MKFYILIEKNLSIFSTIIQEHERNTENKAIYTYITVSGRYIH